MIDGGFNKPLEQKVKPKKVKSPENKKNVP